MSGDGEDGPGNGPVKAYENPAFIHSRDARPVRILSEYLEPEARFARHGVSDTIVFFGSARIKPADEAKTEQEIRMARFYEEARQLARRLTLWSKSLEGQARRFVVCTGGGPGIMEAANRGASEAKGLNIGLNIALPHEQHVNPYVSRELHFEFNYFFMRKFWFGFLAKAIIIFPGGFGTLDEFFEVLTLMQTRKITKPLPVVLYGSGFWDQAFHPQAMLEHGTVAAEDIALYHRSDSVDEAFDFIVGELTEHYLDRPGGHLDLV